MKLNLCSLVALAVENNLPSEHKFDQFLLFSPQIDEQLVNLPYRYSKRKIVVYCNGQDTVVETNFGLIVTYDWHSRVTATVPSDFANALCGLCGNYNGAASDDMMMRNNHVTSDPVAFGSS